MRKKKMLEVYNKSPQLFMEYAEGDLMNYDALLGHFELFKELYEILDLKKYYTIPKPTIGSSIHCLIEAALKDYFSLNTTSELYNLVRHCSHDILIQNCECTQAYLAKTNGGRCYNNCPMEPSVTGVLIDIDIKSCYGKGLQLQDYPIGRPIIIDYKIDSAINDYKTLKEFLEIYEDELVNELWFCRISTKEKLSFNQDFFCSWYPPANLINILKTDTLKGEEDVTLDGDQSRIYSRELNLSPLQSDGIEWIRYTLTKKEREEFLSKCMVIAAAFYPKSTRCESLKEFYERNQNHEGKNECYVKIKQKKAIIKTFEENYYWYSGNLGSILITKLLKKRELYSNKIDSEMTMNKFIKLVINTTYGDLVSLYFYIGNTIVGNNITARARAM